MLSIATMALSVLCVWISTHYAWSVAYAACLAVSLYSGWIAPIGLLALLVFALAAWASTLRAHHYLTPFLKTFVIVTTLVAAARIAPGFTDLNLLQNMELSANKGWSSLRFSAEKVSIGIFFLIAYRQYLCKTFTELYQALLASIVPILLGCVVVYATALAIGYATIDTTITPVVLFWLFRNLLFTVVAEEAFFRLFIQQGLQDSIKSDNAPVYALIITALFFGLVHAYGGWHYWLLATMAGLLYGYVYMRTGRVESSIVAHSVLNTGHFVFLSY